MLFSYFLCVSLSKELILFKDASDGELCETGCNFNSIKKRVQDSDKILINYQKIEGDDSYKFMEMLNGLSSVKFSIIGNNTVVSFQKTNFSMVPLISLDECSVDFVNITFTGLKRPFLNATSTNIFFRNVSFLNSTTKNCALISLNMGEMNGNAFRIIHCTSKNYSLVVCDGSNVNFHDLEVLSSKYTKGPLLYFPRANVVLNSSHFASNVAEELITVAQGTSLALRDPLFDENSVLIMINSETECEVRVYDAWFGNNTGSIIKGVTSVVELKSVGIISHESDDALFELNESVIVVEECNITKCFIKNFMETFGKASSTNAQSIRARGLSMNDTMIKANGGRVEIEFIRVDKIDSLANVVIIQHTNGTKTKITDSKFTKITSKAPNALFCNISNVKNTEVKEMRFNKNKICGFLLKNTVGQISQMNFTKNTCNPKKTNVPYSLISFIKSKVNISESVFINNKVLDGNVHARNSRSFIKDCYFYNNTGVHGTCVKSINTTLDVIDSRFFKNTATVTGAAIHSQGKLVTISSTNFSKNNAPRGPVLALEEGNANFVDVRVGPNIGEGTLVNAIGNCTIHFESTLIHDKKSIAINAKNSTIVLIDTTFGESSFLEDVDRTKLAIACGGIFILLSLVCCLCCRRKKKSILPGALR